MDDYFSANAIGNHADENARLALEECIKRQRIDRRVSALVIPAGHCGMAIKLARHGASVTVGDVAPLQREVENRALAAGLCDEIRFVPCTLNELPAEPPGMPYDIIVLRRGLCCLPYHQARNVVRQLLLQLKIGGKIYISIRGLHSELSEGYAGRERPIEERFAPLSPEVAEKYDVDQPVCLYSERNLFMLLLEAGASVLRTLTTTYGNVKGIGVRV
ncbi:MAG: class I SAM-dependent methyltransferase [Betaproteobacteria bacterium]|nr:class I SAM-dependent methyltransferase [Betaproteobacteria bacterium]MCL2887431.1 class I SAM-dependent methyltransferase [Betaproteobacteria bacterium]